MASPKVRLLVYRKNHFADGKFEDGLVMKLSDGANILADVLIDDMEMNRAKLPTDQVRDAFKRLSAQSGMSLQDVVKLSLEGENAEYIRLFMYPRKRWAISHHPAPAPEPPPEPVPLRTGWAGFYDSVTTAILGSHKVPMARVVKDGRTE